MYQTYILLRHSAEPFFLGGRRQVSAALAGYLAAVEETETTVRLELQALSDLLVANNDLPVIAQV